MVKEAPTSPTIQNSTAPVPWNSNLMRSFQQNYAKNQNNIYLPMSNMKRNGDVSMHCLQFKGFLKDDVRFFKFLLAMNDQTLMGDIKSDPKAKISWTMSNEYYIFKGKFYIASAPIQVTRFPPPKIMDDDKSAAEYWEEQRLQQWSELDDKTRATFTWPSRAEVPRSDQVAFSCQSLCVTEKSVVHDIALDNFCLLVYKVTDVEYLDHSCYPPKRLVSIVVIAYN